MALWRNRELEQIVSGLLDKNGITEDGLRALIAEIPDETNSVEYKQKQSLTPRKEPASSKDGKELKFGTAQEVAKDVCGPANSRGALIVYGVQDRKNQADPVMRMQPFTWSSTGDAHELLEQLRRDVRQHATPVPRFDAFPVPAAQAGGSYYLVVVVPPSTAAPHAVTVIRGIGKKALYYFIRQPGETSVRSLEEYEVARMYADRSRRSRVRREDLERVWDDAADNLEESNGDGVWLVVAALPEVPAADNRLTGQARTDIEWWVTQTPFPDSVLGRRLREELRPYPAPGRLIYQHFKAKDWDVAVPHASRVYEEVYADGTAVAGLQLGFDPGTHMDVEVDAAGLVDDIQAAVRRVLGWLAERTGQWGEATLRLGVIAPGVTPTNAFRMMLVDGPSEKVLRPGSRPVGRDRLPSATLSIDLATTSDTRGQLAAAYSAALPIVQAFAVAEPEWITPDGSVDASNLTDEHRRHAVPWAGAHQVLHYVPPQSL